MQYLILKANSNSFMSYDDGETIIFNTYEEAQSDCKEGDTILPLNVNFGDSYHIGDKVGFITGADTYHIGTISKILVFEKDKEFSGKRIPYQSLYTNTLKDKYDFSLSFDDIGMWCRSSDIDNKL